MKERKRYLGGARLLLMALVAIVGLFAPLAPPGQADAGIVKAQPLLLELAANEPTSEVRVVVQKAGSNAQAEQLVARLGGSIIQDLSMINAFAATLPAQAVPMLASDTSVRWVSFDARVEETSCPQCIDTTTLANSYIQTIGADKVWNSSGYIQGGGVTVAIVDSGINNHDDLREIRGNGNGNGNGGGYRVLASVKFNGFTNSSGDGYGHGTHIAGIIGGNGTRANGMYIGVAPKVNLLNVKVSDDRGAGYISDVVAGLQWVYENKDTYKIRVVNISLNSSVEESYHTSPLNAAVEILWFSGIVVIVSAGNNGVTVEKDATSNAVLYPPANDPFVITVGAINDMGTANWSDDVETHYSAYGITPEGFSKPDILAPGHNIVGLLCGNSCELVKGHPDHRLSSGTGKDYYFRMSGTSMSAAVTTGAVALLLNGEARLTPDQVKYRLMASSRPISGGSAGVLDIHQALNMATLDSANTGIPASQLLWSGSEPVTWNSVSWNSVSWNSVSWNSVSWNSVSWNSVSWNSLYWGK